MPDLSYLLSSSSSPLQLPRPPPVLFSRRITRSSFRHARRRSAHICFYFTRQSPPLRPNPVSYPARDTLDILFATHLNAWHTTWDKKGIHERAIRRTAETQIYFFNIVNITVPGNT